MLQQDIEGGTFGCKGQSLAPGLQYCYGSEARHNNNNNSRDPFIVSSHTTDAKTEENSRTLLSLFSIKTFIQFIIIRAVHVRIFLKYQD